MEILSEFLIDDVKHDFREIIINESHKDYFKYILSYLKESYEKEIIFPKKKDIFNAFKYSDFYDVKAVILGQDPYHNENEAHGLSFSIYDKNIKLPSSLKNIFKELKDDLNIDSKNHGNLTPWAKEGVLLLNSILTVKKSSPLSHKGLKWEMFTDKIIKMISDKRENVVFILWGNVSSKKEKLIDNTKHLIIKSSHPSGLSAHRGFFSSKPFSRTNDYLKSKGIKEINFKLD